MCPLYNEKLSINKIRDKKTLKVLNTEERCAACLFIASSLYGTIKSLLIVAVCEVLSERYKTCQCNIHFTEHIKRVKSDNYIYQLYDKEFFKS